MKSKGYLLMGLGVILLAGALGLFLYNHNLEKEAEESCKDVIPFIQNVIAQNKAPKSNRQEASATKGESVEVGKYTYEGILTIPSLELELPILNHYNYKDLRKSPCRYSGDPSGHLVIAAHNYKSHFGNLSKLIIGDTVYFTTVAGDIFEYRVEAMEELDANDNEILLNEKWDLSLFTCNYLGDKRVTVRCKKQDS